MYGMIEGKTIKLSFRKFIFIVKKSFYLYFTGWRVEELKQ